MMGKGKWWSHLQNGHRADLEKNRRAMLQSMRHPLITSFLKTLLGIWRRLLGITSVDINKVYVYKIPRGSDTDQPVCLL